MIKLKLLLLTICCPCDVYNLFRENRIRQICFVKPKIVKTHFVKLQIVESAFGPKFGNLTIRGLKSLIGDSYFDKL